MIVTRWYVMNGDMIIRGPYKHVETAGAVRQELEHFLPDKDWNLAVVEREEVKRAARPGPEREKAMIYETWYVSQEFLGGGWWIVHKADPNRSTKIAFCGTEDDSRKIADALNGQGEAIRQAVEAEREACARLAEELFPDFNDPEWLAVRFGAGQEVADAIRARGDAELPTLASLRGSFKGAFGDGTTADFLKKVRGEGEKDA